MLNRACCIDPFFRKRPVSRSVSHGRMFEFIDGRLRVAYCYFATLPSQRAEMKQLLYGTGQTEPHDSTSEEQASVSKPVEASDYEFSESALVDKKVRCRQIHQHHCILETNEVDFFVHFLMNFGDKVTSSRLSLWLSWLTPQCMLP